MSRKGYAEIAAAALRKVPSSAGLVVSIEGAWGSGKTSALAMIEALLLEDEVWPSPLIVHFNPWLIGDKDALLRHFLFRIASAVKLNDHSSDGRKVAPKACPGLFDILKASDPTLDQFALYFLGGSWDSTKGESYRLPRDTSLHEVYCPLADFKSHATARLQDQNLQYPERAAWRSVVEGSSLYGIDGTEARH